ncbi:preprotein translocase subunit SecE [Sporolactobacillus sp. THM7-7]|nr:preprotein translocase subunit SecE [Sporolactobacillus sp. THM7-7]
MSGIIKGTGRFFRSVVAETKKVSWPTRKDLLKYTVTVVVTVIFLSVFFALVDLGVSELLRIITNG